MNEEFSISLKTIFDQTSFDKIKAQLDSFKKEFEKGIEVAVRPAKQAAKNTTPNIPSITPTTNPELEEMEARLARIKEEMLAIQMSQKSNVNGMGHIVTDEEWARFDQLEAEAVQLEEAIANAKNELSQAAAEAANIGNGAEESASKFQQIGLAVISIKNNLRPATKQVTRMIGALIGVRSLYSSIRKAMGSYLAQNEELQTKLNGAWYALGSLFAPVLEWIVNLFVRLVSLVDAFVRSLGFAGINMKNYGKAAGKAAKEQKQLAGFDEINNLSSQENGSGGGGGGFNLDKVTDEELQRFKAIATLVAGIAAGIAAWKISSHFAEALGLTAKQCAGIGVTVAGATIYVLSFIDAWKNGLNWYNLAELIGGVALAAIGLGIAFGPVAVAVALVVGGIGLVVLGLKEFIETGELSNKAAYAIVFGCTIIGAALSLITGHPIFAIIGLFVGVILPSVLKNLDKIKAALGKLGKSVSDFYSKNIKPFVDKIKGIVSDIVNNGDFTKLKEFGSDILKAIVEGLKNTVGRIGSWLKEYVFDPIWNGIKKLFGIGKSSSTETKILGESMMNGLFDGLKKLTGIGETFTKIKDAIWEKLGGVKDKILESDLGQKVVSLFDKLDFKDNFDKIKESLSGSNALGKLGTAITNSKLGSKLVDLFKNLNLKDNFNTIKTNLGTKLEELKTKITNSKLGDKLKGLFGGTILNSKMNTIKTNLSTKLGELKTTIANSGLGKKLQEFFDNIKAKIKPTVELPTITGAYSGGNLYFEETGKQKFVAYAAGTDFVPNDQLALLHKGEAVIPAEYNDGIQGSPYNGSDTNALLRELIDVVDSKEFKAYISQNEIGRTAVKYINNQSRIQGGSVV